MHTCEIAVKGSGPGTYESCGKPATKNVLSHVRSSGKEDPEGFVIWMCDEHYEHAAKTWVKCEF